MEKSKEECVWVLSELYYPEDSATGHNVTKVAEGLAVSYSVRALCAQPTYQARGTKAKKMRYIIMFISIVVVQPHLTKMYWPFAL